MNLWFDDKPVETFDSKVSKVSNKTAAVYKKTSFVLESNFVSPVIFIFVQPPALILSIHLPLQEVAFEEMKNRSLEKFPL